MTASDILTAHLPITSRNVDAVAAQIEKYLQANAARIMAQKPSEARRKASRQNGRNGGRPRKDGKPNKNGVVQHTTKKG